MEWTALSAHLSPVEALQPANNKRQPTMSSCLHLKVTSTLFQPTGVHVSCNLIQLQLQVYRYAFTFQIQPAIKAECKVCSSMRSSSSPSLTSAVLEQPFTYKATPFELTNSKTPTRQYPA